MGRTVLRTSLSSLPGEKPWVLLTQMAQCCAVSGRSYEFQLRLKQLSLLGPPVRVTYLAGPSPLGIYVMKQMQSWFNITGYHPSDSASTVFISYSSAEPFLPMCCTSEKWNMR